MKIPFLEQQHKLVLLFALEVVPHTQFELVPVVQVRLRRLLLFDFYVQLFLDFCHILLPNGVNVRFVNVHLLGIHHLLDCSDSLAVLLDMGLHRVEQVVDVDLHPTEVDPQITPETLGLLTVVLLFLQLLFRPNVFSCRLVFVEQQFRFRTEP